jgi:hypothetical protein
MSQTFFSKQGPEETISRLSLLGSSRGQVTLWLKGSKNKFNFNAFKFDKERKEIVLDNKDNVFKDGDTVLCTFELRGMNFFSEVIFKESVGGFSVLQFTGILFKSERRNSFRLLTYPLYEVWADFDLGEAYEGGKVVDFKSRLNQTNLFKSFLKIVEPANSQESEMNNKLSIRLQDLSTTGMALHIGELEAPYFQKEMIYEKVNIRFTDLVIQVPKAKIVYMVDFISNDKNIKKYKLGVNFENLPPHIDDQIGKKINHLLRQNDFNKDFENFVK